MQVTEWFWDLQCFNGKQGVPILLQVLQLNLPVLVLAMQKDVDRLEKDHKDDQMTGKSLVQEKAENAGFAQPSEKKAYGTLWAFKWVANLMF